MLHQQGKLSGSCICIEFKIEKMTQLRMVQLMTEASGGAKGNRIYTADYHDQSTRKLVCGSVVKHIFVMCGLGFNPGTINKQKN